ncbi:MATE family efflux transporter [Geomesophilobacter sediminis]|uniref:MATE family efflux transporter n=1 Tax=Geomesophilobacter sediminis TaxID=2798584 RepID=A0A8J7IN50_9BACT|nr:MATE family efflux transporter [Geomesophilobacter sediminis]MBJ6723379.1 MATE family efflux transporter [Geomesophilobacter sediminis]
MNGDLITAPIGSLLRRLAVPVGIGFFFNTMFNVVDTWYAGQISTQAVAAVSLSFPLFFLIIAMGGGISTGATALMGHALGAGRSDQAELYAAQVISFSVLHGILLSAAGNLLAPAAFRLMGAQGAYLDQAVSYMGALFAGAVFFVTNQAQNGILNATGDTKSYRNFLVTAFILNMIYDPWFIHGGLGLPPLGLPGIAWATVAIQGIGTGFLHHRARKTGLVGNLGWRGFVPRRRIFWELARQGFPASLAMLTVSIGVFVITWFVGRFGPQAVAGYGIATRIEQIVLLPVMGLNVATLALVAQNYGARRLDRVKEAIRGALTGGIGLMTIGTIALLFLAAPMMGLFSKDPRVIAVGASYLHVAAFVLAAYVILYINTFALQGLQLPKFSLWIGLYRQLLAPVPIFWVFAIVLKWETVGVWWGILLVNWSAALLSLLFIRRTVRRLLDKELSRSPDQ